LLIFYHISKVFYLYSEPVIEDVTTLIHVQSVIRLTIAVSLILVAFGVRRALWGMWVSITALVVTRYIALLALETHGETELAVYFSYLRGFIFPTIITLAYPSKTASIRQRK
jgi:hypothetical protein